MHFKLIVKKILNLEVLKSPLIEHAILAAVIVTQRLVAHG